MTEKQKMLAGELYNASAPELIAERRHTTKSTERTIDVQQIP
jgi:hypothetical protein